MDIDQEARAAPDRKGLRYRLFDFIEDPFFLTSVGLLGGIVGLLFYTPFLILCGICILFAFHRAKVVSGYSLWKVQVPAYIVVFVVTSGILYLLRISIARKLREQDISVSGLVAQIVSGVISGLPKASEQPTPPTPRSAALPPPTPAVPFAFAVEVQLVSPGFGNFTGFWFKPNGPRCSLLPIDDLLFLRVTNVHSTPKTIINYTMEAQSRGKWYSLRRLDVLVPSKTGHLN